MGRAYAEQTVRVQCDAPTHEWVVTVADGTVVQRLPIHGMDGTTLTGIPDIPPEQVPPIQLTLPLAA